VVRAVGAGDGDCALVGGGVLVGAGLVVSTAEPLKQGSNVAIRVNELQGYAMSTLKPALVGDLLWDGEVEKMLDFLDTKHCRTRTQTLTLVLPRH
jgi:hypothetical protein